MCVCLSHLASLSHGEPDERALAVALGGVAALAAGEQLQRLHGGRGAQAVVVGLVLLVVVVIVALVLLDGVYNEGREKGRKGVL